jgi:hypothetical protein
VTIARKAVTTISAAAWVVTAYGLFLRPWQLRWGATENEVRWALPGNEIVGLCRLVDYADRGVKVLVSEERWVE